MKTEKIAFTSKINFVPSSSFDKFRRGKYIDIKNLEKNILVADEFFSEDIFAGIAGGIIDTKNKLSVGFNLDILDRAQIKDVLDTLFKVIPNPDKALIIGGNSSLSSLESFNIFADKIIKKVQNVSIFKEHIFPSSKSNIHYDLYNDEWTINSIYQPLKQTKHYDIESRDDIKRVFRHAKVPNDDTLFIEGQRIDSSHFI